MADIKREFQVAQYLKMFATYQCTFVPNLVLVWCITKCTTGLIYCYTTMQTTEPCRSVVLISGVEHDWPGIGGPNNDGPDVHACMTWQTKCWAWHRRTRVGIWTRAVCSTCDKWCGNPRRKATTHINKKLSYRWQTARRRGWPPKTRPQNWGPLVPHPWDGDHADFLKTSPSSYVTRRIW